MFRFRAAMDSDPAASGHLVQDRQQALEFGTLGHADAVDERWDQVIGVLQGRADRREVLLVDAGAS